MKTIVYVDGYNLFYGLLRQTNFKWLDLFKLFQEILKIQNPDASLIKIKYFTAPVKANFSTHGAQSSAAQNTYHRALKHLYGEGVEIIMGYHSVERGYSPRFKKPIDKNDRVEIWKFEEKQTDVNIALNMYQDAIYGNYNQQVLVSNDSDLELPLKMICEAKRAMMLGLIIPRTKPDEAKQARPVNKSLSQYVSWTRKYIADEECQSAQFVERIATHKKMIIKPEHW